MILTIVATVSERHAPPSCVLAGLGAMLHGVGKNNVRAKFYPGCLVHFTPLYALRQDGGRHSAQ